MSFLDIPEDVIWEMSLDLERDEPYDRLSPPRTIKCNRCGCPDLLWTMRNGKWDLMYKTGKLAGKLHGCDR